jgi:pimeloyl-ACP methyl ester carboxylesterase
MTALPGWQPAMVGATPYFATSAEPRFPYCLYVPERRGMGPAPLIVAVHGSDRRPEALRDLMAPFCERSGAVLLLPLFPIGATAPDDEPGYKFGMFRGLRYDQALLAMVADAARRVPIVTERFTLFGYSGGGQFALRFLMLQPRRLAAVSIGAPGYVTLLDPALPWWSGVEDFAEIFGHPPDLEAMREVAIHLVVGADDVETEVLRVPPDHPLWVRGAEQAGPTRIARIEALEASLRGAGCDTRLDHVAGVEHAVEGVFPAVEAFLQSRMTG